MSAPGTEARLRDALDALSSTVTVSDEAYRGLQRQWRRRERRRRRVAALVATALVLVADGIGLWALNQAEPGSHVVFDTGVPVGREDPAGQLGQP